MQAKKLPIHFPLRIYLGMRIKFSLLDEDSIQRWFKYRDNRNNTAHDYGKSFAEETLLLIDDFILDVKILKKVIDNE